VEVEPVDAAVVEVEPIDAGMVDAGVAAVEPEPEPVKLRPSKRSAAVKQLKERIAKLEARAKRKKGLEPGALQALRRLRTEALGVDTVEKKVKVERALSDWERSFLKK